MHDVIVVGGGPAGLHTARLCEKGGYKVVIVEEDAEIGKPLKCSGLISRNVRKFFPDIERWGVVENEIDSAVLHSRRSSLVFKKPKAAYVINRTLFDKKMAELVESEIMLGCTAERIAVKNDCVEVITSKGVMKGKTAAICDGPNSMFVRRANVVKGLIAIVKKDDSSGSVDLYFDKRKLHDGFFWRIPRGASTEYGAWGKDVKFADVERFFGIRRYERHAGLIPVGPVKKSYAERILMVGSSAGQVKPWSGGGVVYGLTCAELAAKTIDRAFALGDFSKDVMKGYENAWKSRIGAQIKAGLVFRKLLGRSSDLQLDVAFRTGRMLRYGWMDMDFIV